MYVKHLSFFFAVVVRVVGGEAANPSSLAPKIGPLGLSPKKVGDDIAKATQEWKGLRVTVKLTVKNREATVTVVPSAAALIIKALNEPIKEHKKGEPSPHKGNLKMSDIINIAKVMRPRSMAKTFAGTVKEVLGTCKSVGIQVEGEDPKVIQAKIDSGEIAVPNEP
jgi:large subunit ribosomal protein L12e